MTRIIGGVAGSLKLGSPAKVTRPTSDRVRESIFSRLEARDALDGAAVLDLYAGTGALALEAISRGAAMARLVERDGKAAAVCLGNTKLVEKSLKSEDIDADIKVITKAASAYLSASAEAFDLVFIDPPYEVSNTDIEALLGELKLNKSATIVIERSSRTDEPNWPAGFELEDTKDYGDTVVYWLRKN